MATKTSRNCGGLRARIRVASLAVGGVLAIVGCHQPDFEFMQKMRAGQYGQARAHLLPKLDNNPGDRGYTITRMKLGVMDLADGLPGSAERTLNETYNVLRTQGLNDDKTVEAVVVNESLKRWKGEPFEQALMYCFISVQKAMQNDWGNARAAAENALFMLKDFSEQEGGGKTRTLTASRFYAHAMGQDSAEAPRQRTLRIATADKTWFMVENEVYIDPNLPPQFQAQMRARYAAAGWGGDGSTFRSAVTTNADAGLGWLASTEAFEKLHETHNLELVGEDIVDGQEVWVIQLQPKTKGAPGRQASPVLLWAFNKETGVLVQKLTYDDNGILIKSESLANIQINAHIPEAAFEPEPGVFTRDMRR